MKKLFRAALVAATLSGFQAIALTGASAQTGSADTDLTRYAVSPWGKNADTFRPFKVASRWTRRRNRAIAGGIAVGIAALVLSEAIRANRHRRHHYYDDGYYYSPRTSYPGYRTCRIWARRCDYGNRRACRKWNRRCR